MKGRKMKKVKARLSESRLHGVQIPVNKVLGLSDLHWHWSWHLVRFDQICVSILLEPYRGDAKFY